MKKHRYLLPSLFNEFEEFRNLFNWDIENFPKSENNGISLYENQNKIFVEASLPGIDPKDIQINIEKGVLWIKAESEKEKKEEEKNLKYYMKAKKHFSYRVPIPSNVDETAKPEASYKNGILKITFEKSKTPKAQKIEIKIE